MSDSIYVGPLMGWRVLWRAVVRCAEYQLSEDQSFVSQSNGSVEVRCVQESGAAGQTWTMKCVDGEWVNVDGLRVDCVETGRNASAANQSLSDTTETYAGGTQGTGIESDVAYS